MSEATSHNKEVEAVLEQLRAKAESSKPTLADVFPPGMRVRSAPRQNIKLGDEA